MPRHSANMISAALWFPMSRGITFSMKNGGAGRVFHWKALGNGEFVLEPRHKFYTNQEIWTGSQTLLPMALLATRLAPRPQVRIADKPLSILFQIARRSVSVVQTDYLNPSGNIYKITLEAYFAGSDRLIRKARIPGESSTIERQWSKLIISAHLRALLRRDTVLKTHRPTGKSRNLVIQRLNNY